MCYFNPLRPCGRRLKLQSTVSPTEKFQSTPPVWAETARQCPFAFGYQNFNPLRPCGRRLQRVKLQMQFVDISIHSARVGGDATVQGSQNVHLYFNPLRPCGRRQQKKPFFRLLSISITTYFTEKSKRTRCKFSHLGYLFQYSLLILVRTSLYVDV